MKIPLLFPILSRAQFPTSEICLNVLLSDIFIELANCCSVMGLQIMWPQAQNQYCQPGKESGIYVVHFAQPIRLHVYSSSVYPACRRHVYSAGIHLTVLSVYIFVVVDGFFWSSSSFWPGSFNAPKIKCSINVEMLLGKSFEAEKRSE